MKKINWENGTLVSKAKVMIDGVLYEVEPAQYNGKTALSAENLRKMENNTEEAIEEVKVKAYKEILWENTTNLNTFSPQEITLNSSDYDYLIIYAYRNHSATNKMVSCIVEKNKIADIIYSDYFGGTQRSWQREVTVNEDKVNFGECAINGGENNTTLVPYKIMGCKY